MPSQPTGAHRCWNCDRTVDSLTPVTLDILDGQKTVFQVCQRCYTTVYLPLMATEDTAPHDTERC
jgi:hypothetical protein